MKQPIVSGTLWIRGLICNAVIARPFKKKYALHCYADIMELNTYFYELGKKDKIPQEHFTTCSTSTAMSVVITERAYL